jgi:hypothetical protein
MRQHKDTATLREGDRTTVQHKSTRGTLRDYSLKHRVSMEWEFSEEGRMDLMFKLKIDDYEVILDSEEILRLLRWV